MSCFSVNPGWGLIVLNLGAASLLVWGVLEIVQGKASRRGIVLVSGTVAMVAIVATAAILAASGRFEDPNDSEQPVAQLQDSEDTEEQPTFDSPSDDDAPVEEPPSEPFSEPSPESDPAAPEDDRSPTQDKTKSCGNLTVTADSITCGFANNVFYEYWVASDGGSSHAANISAYSDALGRYLELACNVGKAVSCVTDADGHVSIPRGALDDYSQADADDYAASNTVSR